MHDDKRWRLVCYDVRQPGRYRQLHKLIKGFGTPVQYSVFRCFLDDRTTAELRWRLEKILEPEDSLLVLDLCPTCAGKVVSRNHVEGWDEQPPAFLLVDGSQAPTGDRRRKRRDRD
ncbi:CRISPR-associated endonuclease Cas2 [Acidobacteria bacterium ACD]|nr:MAG: CRISPR-associated endonuclease Cas2 [Acidobacteriota bacterium]MCE7958217.1 CRISPR-associated endonuclease Cas2 [Acidobacteria bacterium ACB2]MDL1948786.1 CRISPR-associated endonuclease Cas2 [Acidobacteria bacterium ACD]